MNNISKIRERFYGRNLILFSYFQKFLPESTSQKRLVMSISIIFLYDVTNFLRSRSQGGTLYNFVISVRRPFVISPIFYRFDEITRKRNVFARENRRDNNLLQINRNEKQKLSDKHTESQTCISILCGKWAWRLCSYYVYWFVSTKAKSSFSIGHQKQSNRIDQRTAIIFCNMLKMFLAINIQFQSIIVSGFFMWQNICRHTSHT